MFQSLFYNLENELIATLAIDIIKNFELNVMELLKIGLLILAYSLGLATLVVQVICYLKDLEYKETIAFSLAFLLLIAATTIQVVFKTENASFHSFQALAINLLTVAFSVSIPINIHKERVYKQRKLRNWMVALLGFMVLVGILVLSIQNCPSMILVLVAVHLFLSVVYSMLFILLTKPGTLVLPREKSERILAVIVLIIMVLSLVQFLLNVEKISLEKMPQNGGFVLAIICIMLSGSKLWGDMKKLFHPEFEPEKVGIPIATLGLTPREQEVAQLLVQGKTYKEMAAELFVSLPTVKTHVSNIYAKAQVRNRLELSNILTLSRNKI